MSDDRGTTDQFTSANSEQFQSSNLNQDSALSESWLKLAFQMQPSQGAGSGQIDPSSINNDAQWLRQFSLVVYKSGVTAAAQQGNQNAAALGAVSGASAEVLARRSRGDNLLQFPRRAWRTPTPFDDTPSTTLDDVSVSAPSPSSSGQQQQPGLDLSNLRCVFNINKTTNSTPNILYARVYNLSPQTLAKVIEFTRVQIHAGYKYSNYGLIFDGKVVQYRRGKENPVDTYLEIHAGDGDDALNGATVFDAIPANTTDKDKLDRLNKAKQELDAEFKVQSTDQSLYQQHIKRTQVLAGQVKGYERELMLAYNADHYMDNGSYVIMSKAGYRPGEAVILSPKTGLVGLPEVTPQGIQAKCLLNPRIRLGGLVKIDSNILSGVAYTPGTASKVDDQGNVVPGDPTGGVVHDTALFGQQLETAFTSPIGLYKILLMNYNGDTRGNPWYCDLIMVALDSNKQMMIGANPSSAFRRASAQAIGGVGSLGGGASGG